MGNKQSDDAYELSRYCCLQNTLVIGGASKLFNHFLKNHPKSVYSFSSNDISNGDLYKKLGFKYERTNVSYWYVDSDRHLRYHRTAFSKRAIVQKGLREKVDSSWTEKEVTQELGLLKIYDTGQQKWVFNR